MTIKSTKFLLSNNTRNVFLDAMKGLAIIFVVWGHAIQYIKKDGISFFDNPLFIIIYSFHMPFFMIISGYLFHFSLSRHSGLTLSLKKIKQLLIPAISWFVIESVLIGFNTHFKNIFYGSIYLDIKNILYGSTYFLWFLTSLFVLSIVYIACHSIKEKYAPHMFTIIFILSLFYGDDWSMDKVKFMAPYFMMGILVCKHMDFILKNKHVIGFLSIGTWMVMLLLWDKQYYIYITPMSYFNVDFWQHTKIIMFRYLIGFAGSFSMAYLCYFIISKDNIFSRFISFFGLYTLPIYAISTLVIYRITNEIDINNICENTYVYNLIITTFFSLFILLLCILIANLIKRNTLISSILFGGR